MATPEAATLVVSPTPGVGDYTTIQDAVDNLPVGGGFILVREGDYSELLVVDIDVIIKGCGRGSTTLNIGSADNVSAITNQSTSARIVVRDMTIVGDPTKTQNLITVGVDSEVIFENVEITDFENVVDNGSADVEVTFSYCTLSMPDTNDWCIWNGSVQGGELTWEYVEANIQQDSPAAINGSPNWSVTDSYMGGGPTYSTYEIGVFTVQGFRCDHAIFELPVDNSHIVNLDGTEVKWLWQGNNITLVGSRWSSSDGNPSIIQQGSHCVISGCNYEGSSGSTMLDEDGTGDFNRYGPNVGFGGSNVTGTSSSVVGPKFSFTVPGEVTADAATNDNINLIQGTGDEIDTLQAACRVQAPTGDDLIVEFLLIDLATMTVDSSLGTIAIPDGDFTSGRVGIAPTVIPIGKGILMQVNQVGSTDPGNGLTGIASLMGTPV